MNHLLGFEFGGVEKTAKRRREDAHRPRELLAHGLFSQKNWFPRGLLEVRVSPAMTPADAA
jgi:hypothetical protein